MTPDEQNYAAAVAALERAVALKRERAHPSMAAPVPGVLDYAGPGVVVERAVVELAESMPAGQVERTECAFRALRACVALTEAWLRARGYAV